MSSSDLASRGDQRAMGMQWYIIHTYSGFEKKVKESLESRVAAFNLQDKIGRVLIRWKTASKSAAARKWFHRACRIRAMCWWRWTLTKTPGTSCARLRA